MVYRCPVCGDAACSNTSRIPAQMSSRRPFVFGSMQTAHGYSELVDPVEQRERLVAQSTRAAAGDPEAMRVDDDFLRAMEYGMPPTAGMGMGVDRLLMTLSGLGIRETILYPLVRNE